MNLSLPEQCIESFALTVLEGYGLWFVHALYLLWVGICPTLMLGQGLFAMQETQIRLLLLLRTLREDKALWRQHSDHAQKSGK